MGRRLINRRPGRFAALHLTIAPFVIIALLYAAASAVRLAENPNDKLLPAPTAFVESVQRLAFSPDQRSGTYLWWNDTAASLERLGIGLAVSVAAGLVIGVAVGLIPVMTVTFRAVIAVISVVPPLALLPILFIVFGLGETGKIVLIIIGITPFLVRDMAMRVGELPTEQLIKAQTLGASTWQIVTRVVLPQILPRLVDAVRLSLGPAWLFLIASEAIAATEGLGYRIFLVRRYMAMDVILPYVAWITLLAYVMDLSLRHLSRRAFPWAITGEARS
jgi:NitT/TauT family transport system permease protein